MGEAQAEPEEMPVIFTGIAAIWGCQQVHLWCEFIAGADCKAWA